MEAGREDGEPELKEGLPVLDTTNVLVRADEVDAEPSDLAPRGTDELGSPIDPDLEIVEDGLGQEEDPDGFGAARQAVRPILQRDSIPPPPPPRQPPPPAPPAQSDILPQPTDSLSLGQLKNIVANFPKLEPIAYAYTYDDTRSFPEELEEWFQYTEQDRSLVEDARGAFEKQYGKFRPPGLKALFSGAVTWLELQEKHQVRFVEQLVEGFDKTDAPGCLEILQCLAYLAMGVWKETTAKVAEPSGEEKDEFEPPNERYRKTVAQLEAIHESATLICQSDALPKLFSVVRHICDRESVYDPSASEATDVDEEPEKADVEVMRTRQLDAALTTMYFLLESGRRQLRQNEDDTIRRAFVDLDPGILEYFSDFIARIRWEDDPHAPFTKIMLMLWKSTLLVFGDSSVLANCKKILCKDSRQEDESVLTTSPLDYHVFRQEITSKYPSYNPPPPLIPLELNNNSILPPQPHTNSRSQSHDNLQGLGHENGNSTSIFHQPVHIATPAPSPPPSPAGPGGKGGKKQNYQTNQNFPFLYPPLDSSSNELGGKGKTELQDKLVGKRWEGGDVPASILEAGQLFASRMRMSRALNQLWDVREEFIRFERGWEIEPEHDKIESQQLEEEFQRLDLGTDNSSSEDDNFEDAGEGRSSNADAAAAKPETDDPETLARLEAIETYFRKILPQLQSLYIVLLKMLLSNITVLGGISSSQPGMPAPTDIMVEDTPAEEQRLPEINVNLAQQLTNVISGAVELEQGNQTLEGLNAIRTREITSKAISGFMLSMLKWFRLSHVLKFEYATQLLLDSNYMPLALKYFALQDIDKSVDLRHDRNELDFFHVCHLLSGHPQSANEESAQQRRASSSSVDSAAPPPIARNRPSSTDSSPPPSPGSPGSPPRRPEVDELGYPTTALPPAPLTTYAPRFFYTYITTLRLLQKLTKGHAHRALLLVQYKSSTILRKALKIPQPSLRLYTLKLFKTQVPFCGRKWRQANMRVITAIYVFCRMGLRDEWISGGGPIEELVEGAFGIESAWRGLVGWWLARKYRAVLAAEAHDGDGRVSLGSGVQGANCGEDFFARELEKMGWGVGAEAIEDEEGEWGEWDGGPLELDGW